MQKALMALSSKIFKAGDLILLMIKKYKTKITFAFILKESYFIFKVKEFSFCFWFKKKARLKFFLCISCKIVPYSWTSIDIRNLLLCSLVFGLLEIAIEKRFGYEWEGILKVAWKPAGPLPVFVLCMKMEVFSKFNL